MTAEGASMVEVGYCQGWDPQVRTVVAPMGERQARGRDESGEPYAVLLRAQGVPKALFQVDWGHGYLGLFLLDAQARRTREFTYRQLEPGRLHLRRYREWRHVSDTEPEFPEHGWRFTMTIGPDGRAQRILDDEGGGSLHIGADVPVEHRTVAKAEFGAWTAYADAPMLGLDDPITLAPAPDVVDAPASGTAPTWSAPLPLRPRHLEVLFTPGRRLARDDGYIAVVAEPEHAGPLRLPTGSVLAADPGTVNDRDLPFTVTVPPGDYPVLIAAMRWEHEGGHWGETPAAMLRITDEPTTSWELALRPGQDARLLDTDEFFGFGVDSGTACFLDATGRDTLPELFHWEEPEEGDRSSFAEVRDPQTGTNLIRLPQRQRRRQLPGVDRPRRRRAGHLLRRRHARPPRHQGPAAHDPLDSRFPAADPSWDR
ncbi:hypothetical protein DPM19_00955 [Actinomadura craniellae]|uniref:DUF4241 domain-containing protein n=1 Tax=Actinomadura craniellae TaxID=2231787 RepID=A0A365HCK7_9ACTN|nr:DUF4241 domain-containing protein [Actinomadura craniellae]RAY16769.1 hypothetical protein DPM19_00955 [Actinomadura craniellae]